MYKAAVNTGQDEGHTGVQHTAHCTPRSGAVDTGAILGVNFHAALVDSTKVGCIPYFPKAVSLYLKWTGMFPYENRVALATAIQASLLKKSRLATLDDVRQLALQIDQARDTELRKQFAAER